MTGHNQLAQNKKCNLEKLLKLEKQNLNYLTENDTDADATQNSVHNCSRHIPDISRKVIQLSIKFHNLNGICLPQLIN